MTRNQLKKVAKRLLPRGLLATLQRARQVGYRPPSEIAEMRSRHLSYQSGSSDEIVLRPGITLRIDPRSREPFEWFCFRSPEMVNEMDCFIAEADKFDSFADIGANHGVFSLAFSAKRPNGRTLAVDPSPIAFEILEQNRRLNGFKSMRTLNIACGERAGEIRMVPNWHHLEAVNERTPEDGTVLVPVAPLDELCRTHDFWPDLLKIDVEGFELPVLHGARQALYNAKLLFLEIHPERIDELGLSQIAIFEQLSDQGWMLMTLRNRLLTKEEFADRIHTFWTVCRKADAAA